MRHSQSEIARLLGVSRQAVNQHVKSGRLSVDESGKIDIDDARLLTETMPPSAKTAAAFNAQKKSSDQTGGEEKKSESPQFSYHVVKTMREAEEARIAKLKREEMEGQLIRLSGQGSPGTGGAPAGDLFLEVQFKPDARWRAIDRDVYQPVAVAPWEAELGAVVEVQTPAGALEVTVPAHWKTARKLRLKGRGIPAATPGDLYLELTVALPPAHTDAERAAYTALAQAFPRFNPRATPGA